MYHTMNDKTKHIVCIEGKRNVDKLTDKLLNNGKNPKRERTL